MSEKKSRLKKFLGVNFIIVLIVLVAGMAFMLGHFVAKRNHGNIYTKEYAFTESSRKLTNPNRGFYRIYGFMITDEGEDYSYAVEQKMCNDSDTTLAMMQINLNNYSDGPISQEGLMHIEELFGALESMDKHYLVRFVYDWDGKNMETEPESADIILNHMKQLEGIFREYKDIIFVHQGLFIGNWGEMNGTRHLEHMKELAMQLAAVTDESTFLGVRMPAQWRKITDIETPLAESLQSLELAGRLSLFNDGMMGNEGDYGTYGTGSKEEEGIYGLWNRAEELAFQEELCKVVPNGGEVIIDNPYNDFENAVKDMNTMHVTYINRWYDENVLNKWADTIVSEEGCFDGMDGLSYVERHLGYRLFINDTALEYAFWEDTLSVDVTLQNVGFAPVYKDTEVYMVIYNEESGQATSYRINQDIRKLSGGNDADKSLTVHKEISMSGFESGEYSVYFYIRCPENGVHIQLANEQDEEEYGYRIGQIWIEEIGR